MPLHFLIEHGAWVWKGLVVTLTVAGLAITARGRDRGATRDLRDLRDRLVRATTPVAVGPVVLRGILRDGRLATIANASGKRYSFATGAPWLECADGTRVAFDPASAKVVIAGSLARRASLHVGAPRGTPKDLRALARGPHWVLSTVAPGDDLVVVGNLHRAVAAGERGYRDDHTAWRLAEPHVLAARPRARAKALPAATRGLLVAGFAATAFCGLALVGAHALDAAYTSARPTADRGALAVAAAMPLSRDRALDHLAVPPPVAVARRLEHRHYR